MQLKWLNGRATRVSSAWLRSNASQRPIELPTRSGSAMTHANAARHGEQPVEGTVDDKRPAADRLLAQSSRLCTLAADVPRQTNCIGLTSDTPGLVGVSPKSGSSRREAT